MGRSTLAYGNLGWAQLGLGLFTNFDAVLVSNAVFEGRRRGNSCKNFDLFHFDIKTLCYLKWSVVIHTMGLLNRRE